MLEYDRIDISKGIDIKKCKETSTECSLCKFSYFFDKNFNYGPYLCNGCYDVFKGNKEHYKCSRHKFFAFKSI